MHMERPSNLSKILQKTGFGTIPIETRQDTTSSPTNRYSGDTMSSEELREELLISLAASDRAKEVNAEIFRTYQTEAHSRNAALARTSKIGFGAAAIFFTGAYFSKASRDFLVPIALACIATSTIASNQRDSNRRRETIYQERYRF